MPVPSPPSAIIARFMLASSIIGHRQRPFGFAGVERHHDEPACRCTAERVLQRIDYKFSDNQPETLSLWAIEVGSFAPHFYRNCLVIADY